MNLCGGQRSKLRGFHTTLGPLLEPPVWLLFLNQAFSLKRRFNCIVEDEVGFYTQGSVNIVRKNKNKHA